MTDCQICFEPFNKSNRLQISCVYCTHGFCRTCVGQYLLSQQEQITCPDVGCRMPWTEEFVDEHMYAVFRKGALGEHRQKFVLDRQKARLPELQARARRYKIAVDGMEGRLKHKAEYLEQYAAVPVVAEDNRLSILFRMLRNKFYDVQSSKWKIYTQVRRVGENGRYAYFDERREDITEEQEAEYKVRLAAAMKERDDAFKVWDTYHTQHKDELERANAQYAAPAKTWNTMPEYRNMVERYGAVIRLYERDTKRIESYRGLFGEDAVEIVQARGQATVQAPRQVVVLRGCPGEGCRGFLNEAWSCGVCDLSVCRHCHVGLEEDEAVPEHHGAGAAECAEGKHWHVCNPDQLATAKMLARDTKPCPKCKALISKIDGCDQMWCTQCQTPFSWITGQVEEGRVHNPHYYEWLRRTRGAVPREPAAPGDVVVGGAQGGDCCADALRLAELPFDAVDQVRNTGLFDNILVDVLEKIPVEARDENATKMIRGLCANFLLVVYRKLVEIHEYYVRDRLNWNERYADQKDDEDAIDFLAGRLSEADWKKRVWQRDRARRFRNDCKEIKRMFYAAGRDILNSLTQGGGSIKVGETLRQIEALRTYANDSMMKAKKRYCISTDPDAISLYHYVGYSEPARGEIPSLHALFGREYKTPTMYAGYFTVNEFLTIVGV